MGDRANIVMEYSQGNPIYFYTHWNGSEIGTVLRDVLARNLRWDHEVYLARMVFCAMVGKDGLADETGFGISSSMPDNEHDLLWVSSSKKTVTSKSEGGEVKAVWGFSQFAALTDEELAELNI